MHKTIGSAVNKATLVATLSSAMECYDFVIYAALIPYLSQNFFPMGSAAQSLNTLLVFAMGYISRPLGGLLFGFIGDKYGRKKTFMTTVWVMALSTFTIGLLPPYNVVGIASPILLILCRFFQGLSQGGEVSGAIIFVSEHATYNVRNKQCAFIFLGLGIGALLSSFVCYLLSLLLLESDFYQWGWRIPFLIGGVLGLISIRIRSSAQETMRYLNQKSLGIEKNPILYLLKSCKKDITMGLFLAIFSASLVTFTLTMPVYFNSFTNFPAPHIYVLMSIGMLTMAVSAPMFGSLADLVGSLKLLKYSIFISVIVIPTSIYYATYYGSFYSVLLMVITIQAVIGSLLGSFPGILANLFPTKVRYTGVAFSYNVASAVGAFIPAVISFIITKSGNHLYVGLLFSCIGLIPLLSCSFMKSKNLLDMEEKEVFQNGYATNKFG